MNRKTWGGSFAYTPLGRESVSPPNLGMISLKSTNKFTLINVVNYCNYQGSEFENEQQMNNQRTTNEQQMNTVKNLRTKELKNKDIKHMCDSEKTAKKRQCHFYGFICSDLYQIPTQEQCRGV